MIIKTLLHWANTQLSLIASGRLDAELLLSETLKKERTYLMAHDEEWVPLKDMSRFRYLIKKRKTGKPLAYILERKEFYGLEFKVNKSVLIPRPDTEILVEAVLSYLEQDDLLLDVGTGSGCIPISVLKNKSGIKAVATDISKEALGVAKENSKRNGVGDRIQFFNSDLLDGVPHKIFENKNVIVTANLPYVPLDHQVNLEATFEPSLALYAKNNGLELYQKLFCQLDQVKPKVIFLECYAFQVDPLIKFAKNYCKKDLKKMLGEARLLVLESKV